MSPLELCDALASKLDAAKADSPYPQAVITEDIAPNYDLSELETTQVAVAPMARSSVAATRRGMSSRDIVVAIGVSRRAKTNKNGKVDRESAAAFLAFIEWADEFVERLGKVGPYTWMGSDWDPIYDAQVLNDRLVFQATIAVTFRKIS